jgi:hypothetical protein
MAITLNLNPQSKEANPRQIEYVRLVMSIAAEYQKLHKLQVLFNSIDADNPQFKETETAYKKQESVCDNLPTELFYGGGIRGGKTYAGLGGLTILCKAFPGSRWGVIRKSMPVMQLAISSLRKIIANSDRVYWKLSGKESYVQFENGSRIYFIAENYAQDKEHMKFKGLELNGFLFEQLEEITEKGFNIIKSRVGSYYNVSGAMPPALILGNFNPTYNWVKKNIYDKWIKGELGEYQRFFLALARDNRYVTKAQWRAWDTLDPITKARMVDGEWDIEVEKAFLYTFDQKKHVTKGLSFDYKLPVWISFDFNVDPMTAVLFQTDHRTFFRVVKCYKIPNSDTYALCRRIKKDFEGKNAAFMITGDASGKNRISGSDGALNQYKIISQELQIPTDRFKIFSFNPKIQDRRVFSNSVISKFPLFEVDESCEDLIHDCKFTLCGFDKEGELEIKKNGVNEYTGVDNKFMGHLMDCLTYGMMITLHNFVKIPKS